MHPLGRTKHQRVELPFGQVPDRREHGKTEMFCHRRKILAPEPVHRVPVGCHRTVRDTPGPVRNDKIGVKFHPDTKPVTVLAGAKRAVEREHPGLEFLECKPAHRACHERRVGGFLSVPIDDEYEPLGFLKSVFDRFHKA